MKWLYRTKQGDAYDILALDIYGREQLSHLIMRENPDYLDVIYFDEGVTLVIPDLPDSEMSANIPTPPWATGVTE
jgi:phage tail protein X